MNRKHLCWFLIILICLLLVWSTQGFADKIAIKILGVNPSRTNSQKVTLKARLPYEAKPGDILDIGDFELDYDVTDNLYYVYKVVELDPGQSASGEIIIKDVWFIKQTEIEPLLIHAQELVDKLQKSPYYDTAVSLNKEIKDTQADIFRTQAAAPTTMPHMRIGVYRKNIEQLDSIKQKIAFMEKKLFEHRATLGSGSYFKLSTEKSWAIILGVVLSLGLISLIFFIIWHKQAGILKTRKHDDSFENDEIL